MQILQGLQAAGALDWLDALDLIFTEDPQYQGAVGRPTLQTLLEQVGFALAHADLSDPDWPHLPFRIDRKARQIAALTAQLQVISDTARALEQTLAAQQAATATLTQDHLNTCAILQTQLQTATEAQETCAADLDLTQSSAAALAQTHELALAALQNQLQDAATAQESVATELATAQAAARDHASAITVLEDQLQTAAKTQDSLRSQLAAAKSIAETMAQDHGQAVNALKGQLQAATKAKDASTAEHAAAVSAWEVMAKGHEHALAGMKAALQTSETAVKPRLSTSTRRGSAPKTAMPPRGRRSPHCKRSLTPRKISAQRPTSRPIYCETSLTRPKNP